MEHDDRYTVNPKKRSVDIMPCVCEGLDGFEYEGVYKGMPRLKVYNTRDIMSYTAYCPKCGRGGCGEFRSAYLALKDWNRIQKICRTFKEV